MAPRLVDFPGILQGNASDVLLHYRLKVTPGKRIAGLLTDLIELEPVDGHRYAWRCWADRRSGLLLKSQQIASDGRVLAEIAFTELRLGKKALVKSRYEDQPCWLEQLDDLSPLADTEISGLPGFGGFRPISGLRSADGRRRQIYYSDGLARSLSSLSPLVSSPPMGGPSRLGARASPPCAARNGSSPPLVRCPCRLRWRWLKKSCGIHYPRGLFEPKEDRPCIPSCP